MVECITPEAIFIGANKQTQVSDIHKVKKSSHLAQVKLLHYGTPLNQIIKVFMQL